MTSSSYIIRTVGILRRAQEHFNIYSDPVAPNLHVLEIDRFSCYISCQLVGLFRDHLGTPCPLALQVTIC